MKRIFDGTEAEARMAIESALKRCVVVDTETTGLEPESSEVVEIALLVVDDGRVNEEFSSRIRPSFTNVDSTSHIHGLTNESLTDAPTFDSLFNEILTLIHGRTLVGHNVQFDIAFLNAEIARSLRTQLSSIAEASPLGTDTMEAPEALCTAAVARRLIPRNRVGRYSLEHLAKTLGTRTLPGHTALSDAHTTFDLLKILGSGAI